MILNECVLKPKTVVLKYVQKLTIKNGDTYRWVMSRGEGEFSPSHDPFFIIAELGIDRGVGA